MVNFSLTIIVGHFNSRSKSIQRNKFIVIVGKQYFADLSNGLEIRTGILIAIIMKRVGVVRKKITRSEVNAGHQGHLHTVIQVLKEICLGILPEVHERHPSIILIAL